MKRDTGPLLVRENETLNTTLRDGRRRPPFLHSDLMSKRSGEGRPLRVQDRVPSVGTEVDRRGSRPKTRTRTRKIPPTRRLDTVEVGVGQPKGVGTDLEARIGEVIRRELIDWTPKTIEGWSRVPMIFYSLNHVLCPFNPPTNILVLYLLSDQSLLHITGIPALWYWCSCPLHGSKGK